MATTTKGIYYPNDGTQSADVLTDMKKMAESIDTAIDGDQFDPTQINESIENLEQDVTALQNSQTTQDLAIENLQGAFLNKTTEEVQSLQVDDANGLGKLDVLGNYTQDGEPSEASPIKINCVGDNKKNLFSLDNRIENIRVNSDYEIESDDKFVTFYSKLEESEYYIITCKRSTEYISYTRLYYGYFDEMPKVGMEARDGGTFYDKDLNNRSIYTSGKYFAISFSKEIVDKKWIYDIQLEKGETATPYIPYGQGSTEIKIENEDKTQFKSYTLPIQQEMLKGDYFVKEADGWKEVHNWQKIDSYNGESISTDYVSTTGALTTGATVFYKITTPVKLACTEEQIEILEQLNNLELFIGTNYITTTEGIAILKLKYEADESEKYAELSNEIEELKQDLEASMLKNTTEQDTSLYINDASEARGKLSIFGNIKQETRSGKNVLKIADINEERSGITVNSEGNTIKIYGTTTAGPSFTLYNKETGVGALDIDLNNTYALTMEMTGTYSGGHSIECNVRTASSNYYLQAKEMSAGTVTSSKNITEEISSIVLYIPQGTTLDVTCKIQLEKGAEYTGYEEYGVSPSPEYPSAVQTLKDSTDITVSNKNLVPALTKNSNYICRCKKGDIFSIQLKGTSTGDARVGIRTYDGEFNDNLNSYVDQKWLQADGTEQTATITSSTDGFVYLRLAGGPPIYTFDYVQVEKGSIATEIIEHAEKNFVLDIQQEMLTGDCFVKEADGWKEVHNWSKKELTGDENITIDDTYNGITQFRIRDIADADYTGSDSSDINAYSNYFKGVAYQNSWTKDGSITVCGGYNVRIMTSKYTTVEDFKQFLKEKNTEENPVYIYYKLADQIKLNCTEEQSTVLDQLSQIRFYKGVNNIFTTENIALLQAQYGVDIETRLNNISKQILEIAGGN